MTIDEIKTWLAEAEENQTAFDSTFVTPESDRRVAGALKTFQANNPDKGKIRPRLEALDAAMKARTREIELDAYLRIRSAETKQPAAKLFEGFKFESEKQIDAKIADLETASKDVLRHHANEQLLSLTPSGSGNDQHSKGNPNLANLSQSETLALEQSGELDAMLKG